MASDIIDLDYIVKWWYVSTYLLDNRNMGAYEELIANWNLLDLSFEADIGLLQRIVENYTDEQITAAIVNPDNKIAWFSMTPYPELQKRFMERITVKEPLYA